MKLIKPFVLSASLIALGASGAAAANSGYSAYVDSIDWVPGIIISTIEVVNQSNSTLVKDVQLGVDQQSIEIPIDASVKCAKDKDISFHDARAYFGPVGLNGLDFINNTSALHDDDLIVGFSEWAGLLNGWIGESSGGGDVFSVPLNNILQGHPTVRVNPVAELEAKLQQHVQGGSTALDFYRNDQEVFLSRPLSVAGACKEGNSPKWGFVTETITIRIFYEGNPNLIEPKLNAQLGNNLPNNFNQQLPFELLTADFMANVPHHVAACPPAQDPSLRVNLNGGGGMPGNVQVKIFEDGAGEIHAATVQLDPNNAGAPIDFDYPLKARLQNNQAWNIVNKTYNHTLRVRARYQDGQGDWTNWSEYDSTVFKHRCTPKLNVNLGNTNGGLGGYQQQGGEDPNDAALILQKQQLPEPPSEGTPTRVAPTTLDPQPTTPTRIKPVETEPETLPKRTTN